MSRQYRRVIRAWADDKGHWWEEAGPWEEWPSELPNWWPAMDRWVYLATHGFLILVTAWIIAVFVTGP